MKVIGRGLTLQMSRCTLETIITMLSALAAELRLDPGPRDELGCDWSESWAGLLMGPELAELRIVPELRLVPAIRVPQFGALRLAPKLGYLTSDWNSFCVRLLRAFSCVLTSAMKCSGIFYPNRVLNVFIFICGHVVGKSHTVSNSYRNHVLVIYGAVVGKFLPKSCSRNNSRYTWTCSGEIPYVSEHCMR